MIEVHAEFPQREVIQANAVVDNEEKTVSEVIISAKPEITGVTASVDNETGTPYVDVTETGTGTEYSFDLAFHNLKGDKGDTGATGQTGATGNGISTIEKTSTSGLVDTYTITFTNGNSTTFNVTNGNGIADISKTSASGLVDTYTITYDNGDTDTFTVTNGKDGIDGQDGQAATITVGSTTTGAAGTNASVVNSGTSSDAILDFTIPKGDKGDTGATGQDGFSPSASVSQSGGVTTISITDKNGTTTESIDLSNYATQTDLTNGLATKQDTLIAGTDLEIVNATTPRLPAGFTELEWLQSDGACYIDLGIISYGNDEVEQKYQRPSTFDSNVISWFGSMQNNAVPRFSIGASSSSGVFAGFNFTKPLAEYDNNIHIISMKKVGSTYYAGFDDATASYAPTSAATNPSINSYLFARNGSTITYDGTGTRIFYHKQNRYDGTPLLDLVPAKRDSDNALGMYNLVSNTFLGNSGTGTFTGGPEVIYPTTTTINFTNASGYTTNEGTVTSVNNTQPDANGDVTLTIPTVNDGVLTITQNGTSKGTFSANQSTNDTIALTDTTYNNFTGADGTNAGSSGLVPAPSATDNDKYLKGDGTWASVSSGSSTDVQINGTSITSGGVANIITNSAYNASSNKIATMSDIPSDEIFVAEYNVTSYADVLAAYNAGKTIFCLYITASNYNYFYLSQKGSSGTFIFSRPFQATIGKCTLNESSGWTPIINYQLEAIVNKTTSISSSSTDTQYPSAKSVIELLKTIYPVGSVYLSTNSTCPMASLFGTWSLVSSGRALWTGTGSNGNTTIAAGLPNIKGKIQGETPTLSGAFTLSSSFSKNNTVGSTGSGAPTRGEISFSAASSNSIYSDSVTTVQPPAYVVNVWRRTA